MFSWKNLKCRLFSSPTCNRITVHARAIYKSNNERKYCSLNRNGSGLKYELVVKWDICRFRVTIHSPYLLSHTTKNHWFCSLFRENRARHCLARVAIYICCFFYFVLSPILWKCSSVYLQRSHIQFALNVGCHNNKKKTYKNTNNLQSMSQLDSHPSIHSIEKLG